MRRIANALIDGLCSYGRGLNVKVFQSEKRLKFSTEYFEKKLLHNKTFIKRLYNLAIKEIVPTQQALRSLSKIIKYKKITVDDLKNFYFQFRTIFIRFFPLQVFPFEIEGILSSLNNDKLIRKHKDILSTWRRKTQDTEIKLEKLLDLFLIKSNSLLNIDFRFYTDKEIRDFFRTHKIVPRSEVIKRKKLYVVFRYVDKNPPYIIYTGKKAKRIMKMIERSSKTDLNIKRSDLLFGKTVNRGKTQGRIYVINKKRDFKKIPQDAIVVAKVVEIDDFHYLKMQKVKSIITEEGGITTHIAISGRELKIPIIMGVKHVTNLLKDGDLVEVDANKGVIKILKKSK